METRILSANEPEALEQAIQVLHAGGLVAFPTDTVYGLAADVHNAQAIEDLYAAKGRDANRAIAVLLSSPAELETVAAEMGLVAERLAERFWPGPLTLVVSSRSTLPQNLSPLPTIGVRMPDHPVALALLSRTGPLAVTSANISNGPNSISAEDVYAQLSGRIPLILDGGTTPGGLPSTVVDCTRPQPAILRQGPITMEQILAAVE